MLMTYRSRYWNSYKVIFKKIYEKYNLKQIKNIFTSSDDNHLKELYVLLIENFTLEIHEENTIYKAIMNYDKESFIALTEQANFDENQILKNIFYPSYTLYTLLELCCFHGAVNCFKLLRTKFDSKITPICLKYSFLSGNPDIINECMKVHALNHTIMEYAILSHNIDFVSFLNNEHKIAFNLDYCWKYNNLQVFLMYLDMSHDINYCFCISPYFKIPSLCQYLISLGANINEKDYFGKTVLMHAAIANSKNIAKLLISHGANIDEKRDRTALHYAVENNSQD